jgi:hypothetical protein
MSYLLARRLYKSITSSIGKILTEKGVSSLVQETFSRRDIITRETKGKEQKTLLEKCDHLDLAERVISLGGTFNLDSKKLIQIDEKQCVSLIKESIHHTLGEYYFLDCTDVYSKHSEGHVVLLRQMKTMSCRLIQRITNGLSGEDVQDDLEAKTQLTFTKDPICMITGVLRSPDIEHLVQQFAILFERIGLEDYQDTTIENHIEIAKGL